MLPRLLVALLVACAPKVPVLPGPLDGIQPAAPDGATIRPVARVASGDARQRGRDVAAAAAGFLGATRLRVDDTSFRWDCSGLVEAAYAAAGIPLRGSGAQMHALARSAGVARGRFRKPRPGDVVFWHNTHDRDGNGRLDDRFTHVGVVERTDRDGRAWIVHLGNHGVQRLRMDLSQRHVHADEDGEVRNDYLRVRSANDRRRTRYLSGELFAGWASLWSPEPPAPPVLATLSSR
ncbi:MAG: hypothetical protein RLZZ299_2381 [Pseudomonadota bacterium]|jgi:hypothetical protein